MHRRTITVLGLIVACALARAGDAPPPEIDVLVNAGSGVTRLSPAELAQIFGGSRVTWGAGKPILAFSLPPSHPLRVEFDRVVLDMSPEEVGRYWIDQRIRGGARPPRQIDDPALVARLVGRMSGAIGYAAAGTTNTPEVRVVARIRNRKVVDP